jgi:uncharacterized membrane protein YcaP (DUF421 family)
MMEAIVRALVVYFVLLIIFRIAGNRTLAQMTAFDMILLLIIGETIQEALVDSDHSMTNAFLLILTLVGTAVLLSLLKQRFKTLERILDGGPVVIIERGKMQQDRMDKIRVDEADIMESARQQEGLRRLDEIDYAVVERHGEVTVIPKEGQGGNK